MELKKIGGFFFYFAHMKSYKTKMEVLKVKIKVRRISERNYNQQHNFLFSIHSHEEALVEQRQESVANERDDHGPEEDPSEVTYLQDQLYERRQSVRVDNRDEGSFIQVYAERWS